MANKRFLLGMLLLLMAFGMTVIGCSTPPSSFVFYSDNLNKEFIILGEVTYQSNSNTGFLDLLNAAKAKYPNCDYVIDIMVDRVGEKTHRMRGTAIQYKK